MSVKVMELENKVCVIAGAIGSAITLRFVKMSAPPFAEGERWDPKDPTEISAVSHG